MAGNSGPDKRRDRDRSVEQLVAHAEAQVLKSGVRVAVVLRGRMRERTRIARADERCRERDGQLVGDAVGDVDEQVGSSGCGRDRDGLRRRESDPRRRDPGRGPRPRLRLVPEPRPAPRRRAHRRRLRPPRAPRRSPPVRRRSCDGRAPAGMLAQPDFHRRDRSPRGSRAASCLGSMKCSNSACAREVVSPLLESARTRKHARLRGHRHHLVRARPALP